MGKKPSKGPSTPSTHQKGLPSEPPPEGAGGKSPNEAGTVDHLWTELQKRLNVRTANPPEKEKE